MYSQEVLIPEKVTVEVDGRMVKVKGEKGSLQRTFAMPHGMKIEKAEGKVTVSSDSERRKTKAVVGTITAHIRNMMDGVAKGYTYRLRVCYSHFPITVKVEKDKVLVQNFLGGRTPKVAQILGDVQVKVEGSDVIVSGIDVDKVSQTAANIEQACRIVGFDKKRFQDGVFIIQKG